MSKLTLEQILENYPNYNYICANEIISSDIFLIELFKLKPFEVIGAWIKNPEEKIYESFFFQKKLLDYRGGWKDSLRVRRHNEVRLL